MDGKKILVLYSSKNVKGKKDATGAFIPEAKAFAKCHGVPSKNMLGIECPGVRPQVRYSKMVEFIKSHKSGIKWIAIFCHGYSSGMQFGLSKKNIPNFVSVLNSRCTNNLKLTLYACSTASTNKTTRKASSPGTDNGYADQLRDHMLSSGFRRGWIDAHLTPGHTTHNPFVVRFYTEPAFDNDWDVPGGEWLVSPKSKLWKKWKRKVQGRNSNFRFDFPLMSETDIYTALG